MAAEVLTDADILMEILAERGEVPLPIIAHVLGVSEDVVENWVKVLEKHGMVKVRYPILGKPVVEFNATTELKSELEDKFIKEQEMKANEIVEESKKVELEFLEMTNSADIIKMKRDIQAHLFKVKGLLDRLSEVGNKLRVKYDHIASDYKSAQEVYKRILEKIDKVESMERY